MYIIFKDIVVASRSGFQIDGTLYVIRLNTVASDQPQERKIFGLKSSNSFKDCSICVMTLIPYGTDEVQDDNSFDTGEIQAATAAAVR